MEFYRLLVKGLLGSVYGVLMMAHVPREVGYQKRQLAGYVVQGGEMQTLAVQAAMVFEGPQQFWLAGATFEI